MKDKEKKSKARIKTWPIIITALSFVLTVLFSIISQAVESAALLWLSSLTVLLFIVISIVADILGTAVTACDQVPFAAMSSRHVRGAKQAVKLLRNSEKMASVCNDVIGDICGILSGAATVSIVALIAVNEKNETAFLLSVVFSALVSCLTIGGKALGKSFAISKSKDIVLFAGRVLAFFAGRE